MQSTHAFFAQQFQDALLAPHVEALSLAMSKGHLCIRLTAATAQQLSNCYWVGKADGEGKPFVLHEHRLYYQRYFRYQQTIVQFAQHCWQQTGAAPSPQVLEALPQLFDQDAGSKAQQAAVQAALGQRFFLLTGGPGTGKTTTLSKLLYCLLLEQPGLRIALCAPTGKAAARMKESLGRTLAELPAQMPDGSPTADLFTSLEPSTVHSLLGPLPKSHYFRHNADQPLAADLVVCDEASMLDAALMAKLIQALPHTAALILIGDPHQLASVEAGTVFGDLCALARLQSGPQKPMAELTISRRFDPTKGIGLFSMALLHNQVPALEKLMQEKASDELEFVTAPTLRNPVLERFVAGFEDYLKASDLATAIRLFQSRCRILCATREGRWGIYQTNRLVEELLQEKRWLQTQAGYYEHQPILITQNLHEHRIYNGDVGLIRRHEQGHLAAYFLRSDGQLFSLPLGLLPPTETAFAMTIHKSQGSEFREIYVVLPPQAQGPSAELLTAELLYTAATRAQNKLVVHSPPELIVQAAGKRVERASGIV